VSLPRWLDLDGVVNMRDVGGVPTVDGGEVATGRLLRSDNLQDLSDGDIRRLVEDVGVTDVVDLRSEVEVHLEGPGPLQATRHALVHHHHSLLASEYDPQEQRDPRDDDYWASHYLGYLADRPDSVSAALGVIAHSTGATIVHCAAGKDRTGTVVGMALSVAGVSDEDVVADYVATGERLDAIVGRLRSRPAYAEVLRDEQRSHELPRPETMQRILTVLAEQHGGAAGWLLEQGWSAAEVDQLRHKLLA